MLPPYRMLTISRATRTALAATALLAIAAAMLATTAALSAVPARAAEFKLIFHEDFSRHAKRGTMGSKANPARVIYRGRHGTKWVTYPRRFLDTVDRRPYRSDRVLSVHDGVLDFYLHPVGGRPAGASPSPLIDGRSQYQTYGRYSARMRVKGRDLSEYHVAWLLWPREDRDWQRAESDFPEVDLVPGRIDVYAHSHWGGRGAIESFVAPRVNMRRWHTYTQEWTPLVRRYYIDGRLIGQAAGKIFNRPQRWQLQIETRGAGKNRGHVLVDWVKVYALR